MKKSKTPAKPVRAASTEKEIAARDAAALARIEAMDDPDKLRNLMANAERMGVMPVRNAAFRRLALIQTPGDPGSVAHEFWQTIHAFEQLLREERGKAVRLTRIRQKIARVGEVRALADFASATEETQGFETLMARDLPEMTGEAIILRHPDDFDAPTCDAARARLESAGFDPATLVA
ncbi:hypothetical protein JSE7799_02440 [Jannaschia seosinensis]|uniref:Uncharacterized protein n=1 Tax=Jannaschia seosinensis TaxID=313367 RepID=A0A0M7BD28_9RHOB|nr:hypothetical protein [Jannaschia seosinensis]CUH39712.1 hypothetical protein JSE7799_02440 [Jannaschia seosinensis]